MIPLCSLHDFGVGEEGKSIFGVLILGARGTKMGSTGRIFLLLFLVQRLDLFELSLVA